MSSVELRALGKRSLEWDLNDWKWDGDLFIARQMFPIGTIPVTGDSSNNSSSCSDEVNLGIERGKEEIEKRRRITGMEDRVLNDESGGLILNHGSHGNSIPHRVAGIWEGSNGNKAKLVGGSSNRAICQVEDCRADLSKAKDYHRRHKVCEMHSKAGRVLVGNLMQRFCQQCSRFHVLQEFDEGKRSCRRRLAGHNKRRRKTNPESAANVSSSNEDQTSGYLLISLLRILSNMHSNQSESTSDQDMISHLIRNIASQNSEHKEKEETRNLQNGTSFPSSGPSMPSKQHASLPLSEIPSQGKSKMNNFDLNDIYIDSDDGIEDVPINLGASSVGSQSHQSSPPQTSGNSDSASTQSPSSSSGEAQSQTDRIVIKLFGKDPGDFPLDLRAQVLDWLAHSPTDIESYIRPGCVVLTIYLRQTEDAWEELCYDLSCSLNKLLQGSDDPFWRTGWIYVTIQHYLAFVLHGQVVVDTSLALSNNNFSNIVSVKPIAVSASERIQFFIRGSNLKRPGIRFLCALEGKYLTEQATQESTDSADTLKEHNNQLQCISFSCSFPVVNGRGFIEVEDHGFSSSFFPFIVAEDDVCSEIRVLESELELIDMCSDATRNGAMNFIHEMGWLLHREQVNSRLNNLDRNPDLYPMNRFKWLMDFSMDHDWCAVVTKLLNLLLDGTVNIEDHPSPNAVLSEMGLLHRAVRRSSKSVVELLLRYNPENAVVDGGFKGCLFRPDMAGAGAGAAGLTPLHIAAGNDGSEDVLDALTNDPHMVGIEAWKNSRDCTGSTPEDYARLRGHFSYIHLVQKKINKRAASRHVVLDIPSIVLSDSDENLKQSDNSVTSFKIGPTRSRTSLRNCRLCDTKLGYGKMSRSPVYQPAMLSMVAIAAVCVCVALLFKSLPEVLYVFQPFRWELLDYGTC